MYEVLIRCHWVESALKNIVNNTHKLTLLDVHYLTYQKTTSKELEHTRASEKNRIKTSKMCRLNEKRTHTHKHTLIDLKIAAKIEVPTAKPCLTKPEKKIMIKRWRTMGRRNKKMLKKSGKEFLKWKRHFSSHCLVSFCHAMPCTVLSLDTSIFWLQQATKNMPHAHNQELITLNHGNQNKANQLNEIICSLC